ncbi:MAG: hypothetical protein K0R28_2815 [Paenibacillus sp.]|jgi:parallel beta-helix repeat protein|nr:hypothetical protein [Paenibacillus sp.]
MAILQVSPGTPGILQTTVDLANAGDLIVVNDGVYNETVTFTGPDDNFIRIVARHPHKAILDSNNTKGNAFVLDNVVGVEINGFLIRNYTDTGIEMDSASNHNRIVNNRIQDIDIFGIEMNGFGNLAWRNEIERINNTGIEFEGGTGNWAVQNVIRNVAVAIDIEDGVNILIGNIVDASITVDSTGNLLFNNQVRNAGTTGGIVIQAAPHTAVIQNHIHGSNGDGISATSDNNFFGDNKIIENKGSGIEISSDFNIVENNEIEDNTDSGILLNAGATGNLILRNELDDNEPRNITDNGVNNNSFQNEND